jgi:glycosyltransferase involved in cell wall biosynthesis
LRESVSCHITEPIPHGVDVDLFQPTDPAERRQTRRDFFGLGDRGLLVGYFGRNSRHKHPELATLIFHQFVRALYLRCEECGRLTAHALDPADFSFQAQDQCRFCGSTHVTPGRRRSTAKLYLHTEILTPEERWAAGGWDLELLIERLGLQTEVILDRGLRIGCGVPRRELVRRMGACDIHLLPFEGGGWELTVLETGACGVPNLIPDFGAPPEYARPFSVLVPVGSHLLGPDGVGALIDVDQSLMAMRSLASSARRRRGLGARGVKVARELTWSAAGEAWNALLRRMSAHSVDRPR